MSSTVNEIKNIQSTGRVRDRVATIQSTRAPVVTQKDAPTRTMVKDIASKFISPTNSTGSLSKPINTGAELTVEDIKPIYSKKRASSTRKSRSKPRSRSKSTSKSRSRSKSTSKSRSRSKSISRKSRDSFVSVEGYGGPFDYTDPWITSL